MIATMSPAKLLSDCGEVKARAVKGSPLMGIMKKRRRDGDD